MKRGIVDRFEGEFVVIEIDGKTVDIPKAEVDPNVKVNDTVIKKGNLWVTDQEETKARHEYMKNLMDSVWED